MKKIIIVLMVLAFFMVGCNDLPTQSTDKKQAIQSEKLNAEAQRKLGLPNITRFQQRKLMKMVYEQCDREDLICYVYIKSDYSGKLIFLGKGVGYGIPFSAQYTNPEKIAYKGHQTGVVTLPQADPNGLFMPTSSSATWLLMIDKKGKSRPVYFEPEIIVSPFEFPDSIVIK